MTSKKTSLIRSLPAVSLAASMALVPAPAHAFLDAGAIISYMTTIFTPLFQQYMQSLNDKVRSEIRNASDIQVKSAEAIAKAQQQERIRLDTIEINEKMRQPALTCATMAMSDNLGKVDAKARYAASQASREQNQSVISQKNSGTSILSSYDNSIRKYCTVADERLGRCKVSSNPEPKLAGADINADMLFTSAADPASKTYMNGQREAMTDYIKRITGSILPESLAARDKRFEDTPAGKAYADMVRRYAAYMSMANYSLNSIVSAHVPEPGLGEKTMMESRVGRDASMMSVIDAYVQEKFSANNIKDAARQVQSEVILREMAQTNAFRLWIEYQNLGQTQRIEAMNALQLALLTEAQLKPMLNAQKAAAMAR